MDKPRVLVVENEILTARNTSHRLQTLGYEVLDVVTSGEEAVQAAVEMHPDVVLMDMQLKGAMDGVQTAAQIRTRCDIPVVYLTAYSDETIQKENKGTEPFRYVLKPFRDQDLYNNIEIALYKHEQERKLLESEERYHTLFAGVQVGLYRTMPDGRLLDTNQAMVEMLGYPDRESLLSVNVVDTYVDPKDRRDWQAQINKESIVRHFEVQLLRYDGTIIWVEDNARAIRAEDGNIRYYEGSLADITERVQAEETLRRSNRELELLNHAGRVLGSSLDLDQVLATLLEETGRLLGAIAASVWLLNPKIDALVCRKATGPASGIVTGSQIAPGKGIVGWVAQHGKSLIVPDAQADDRHFEEVDRQTGLTMRSIISVPLRIRGNVIGVLQVLDTQVGRFDETHQTLLEPLAAFAAIAIENARLYEQAQEKIAEREKAEKALQKNEVLLSNIIDSMSDGILVLDRDFRYIYWNRVMEAISKVPREEVIRIEKLPWEILPHLAEQGVDEMMQQAMRGEVIQSDNIPYRTPDGTHGFTSELFLPLREGTGEISGVIGVVRDVTERVQTEKALRESEERFRLLYEDAPLGYQSLNVDGHILVVNDAWLDLLGYSREEVIGQWFGNFLTPESVDQFNQYFPRLKVIGQAQGVEFEMICKNGAHISVSIDEKISYDAHGGIRQTHCILHDISERKRAEDALRESENRFRTLASATFEGIGISEEGIIIDVNQQFTNIFGYDVNELHGMRAIDLVAPEDSELVQSRISAGSEEPYEHRAIRKDGKIIFVEVRPRMISIKGRPMRVTAVRDLTERVQAESVLRHRNRELQALNEIATAMGQSLDLDIVMRVALNKALEVMDMDAGWIHLLEEDQDWLSLAIAQGATEETIAELKTISLGEGLVGRSAQSGEIIIVNDAREDNTLNAEITRREARKTIACVPLTAKEKTLGTLCIFSRKARQLGNAEMRVLVSIGHQLGVAIENVRLAEEAADIEILRELDRLRSELLANVSHELRTPLGLIKIFATTLLRQDVALDGDTREEFLRNIDDETDKLEEIVNNLLDLSRLEAGRGRPEKHPTDIAELVKEVAVAMTAQSPIHQLVYHLPTEPLVISVHANGIEQVLRNLLGNAIKYSPGGGTIGVEVRLEEMEALIQISDQGVGIPPEDLNRVFERFYRVDNETTRRTHGAGLGLALSQKIVETHGGRMWAESTPGEGSTFSFTLPLVGQPTNGTNQEGSHG